MCGRGGKDENPKLKWQSPSAAAKYSRMLDSMENEAYLNRFWLWV
jgi:hypothetical protein